MLDLAFHSIFLSDYSHDETSRKTRQVLLAWPCSSSFQWLGQRYLFLLIQNDPSFKDELRLPTPLPEGIFDLSVSQGSLPLPELERRSWDPDLENGASLERRRRYQVELKYLFEKVSWCRWNDLILQIFRKAENLLSLTHAFQTQIRGNFVLVPCSRTHGLLIICTV